MRLTCDLYHSLCDTEELLYLAKETGTKVQPNFDELYPAYQKKK